MVKYTKDEFNELVEYLQSGVIGSIDADFVFPSGDYTEISHIPSNSSFMGECIFGNNVGDNSRFTGCTFGNNVVFGRCCRFRECTFGCNVTFGKYCKVESVGK